MSPLHYASVNRKYAYACPRDLAPLTIDSASLTCPTCSSLYRIDNGIALLDVIANAQAAAFDAQHAGHEALSAQARCSSVTLAGRFLDVASAGAGVLDGKDILEVGCGAGALTYGLANTPRVRRSAIYAFDHSQSSLATLRASLGNLANENEIFLSAQDVHALAFRDESFDVIMGCGVLHHFSALVDVVGSLRRMLRPGGIAIFTEPFASGYVILTSILVQAARRLGTSLTGPGFGLAQFIVDDVSFRVQHARDDDLLAPLIDKHLFTSAYVAELATLHGLKWRTVGVERPAFYQVFMRSFLNEYGIEDPSFREVALELYDDLQRHTGQAYGELFPHYQDIVFERPAD